MPPVPFLKKMKIAFAAAFTEPVYALFAASAALNLLLVYFFILLQTTTLEVFFASNTAFYNAASVMTTLLIAVLFGLALGLLLYQKRPGAEGGAAAGGQSAAGSVLGAISTGCPVCGAWLVSALGIGGGLVAFPFQGLELKALALFFLGWAVYAGVEGVYRQRQKVCALEKTGWRKYALHWAVALAAVAVFALPIAATALNIKFTFQADAQSIPAKGAQSAPQGSQEDLVSQVLPEEGYALGITYGDMGPKLIEAGVIDLDKFVQVYERAGRPLTQRQLDILTKGSNEEIVMSRDNAYFLLNLFWAFGLANDNRILKKGPLAQYRGLAGVGAFASTGGWTLSKTRATDYYSTLALAPLTSAQQKELEEFAYNSYRPCCNNSTAFADCNHGMAALGMAELMAAAGASADDMFAALKRANAYWFPQQYLDLARYFQVREGLAWNEVDPRVVMGKNFSTASGWSRVRNWLKNNDAAAQAPAGGAAGCGV